MCLLGAAFRIVSFVLATFQPSKGNDCGLKSQVVPRRTSRAQQYSEVREKTEAVKKTKGRQWNVGERVSVVTEEEF